MGNTTAKVTEGQPKMRSEKSLSTVAIALISMAIEAETNKALDGEKRYPRADKIRKLTVRLQDQYRSRKSGARR